jgi:hypothetical protein
VQVAIAEAPPLIIRRPEDLQDRPRRKVAKSVRLTSCRRRAVWACRCSTTSRSVAASCCYWTAQGVNNLRKYWGLKNMKSIDGLPTDFSPDRMAPPQ